MKRTPLAYRLIGIFLAVFFGLEAAGPGMCSAFGASPMSETHDHSRERCTAPCHIAKTPSQSSSTIQIHTDRRPTDHDAPELADFVGPTPNLSFQHRVIVDARGDSTARHHSVRLHLLYGVFLN